MLFNMENCLIIIIKDFICLFLERGRKGGREPSMHGCLSYTPHWESGLCPGMCPDWESNEWPSGSQVGTQSTEPYQPGQNCLIIFEEGGIFVFFIMPTFCRHSHRPFSFGLFVLSCSATVLVIYLFGFLFGVTSSVIHVIAQLGGKWKSLLCITGGTWVQPQQDGLTGGLALVNGT